MSEEIKLENETNNGPKPTGKRRPHHGKHGRYRNNRRPANPKPEAENNNEIELIEAIEAIEEEAEAEIIPEETTAIEAAASEEDLCREQEEAVEAPAEEVAEAEPVSYTEVIGVRFRASGKIYYFAPEGLTYPLGCHAIVDTARGTEYGEVAMTNREVPTNDLVLPLRQALRIATPEDDRHHEENKKKEAEAAEIWSKKVAQHGLEMKLIDVECTFDNSKLLFYFTADGRVDFRELVKDLASVFRCRIELRQMGIRDEAKILGGLGVCGRPFCCHSFLPDFVQVSIKMAKEQNLSLNSAKISGACGRLMCCLRYEYDTYCEEAKLTPKVDTLVKTPDGVGKIIETKPLLGLVKVQMVNSPDGAPLVFSRELVRPLQPGETIDPPKPPQTSTDAKDKDRNAAAQKPSLSQRKQESPSKVRVQTPKVAPQPPKKAAETEATTKKEPAETEVENKTEKKYSIQRGNNHRTKEDDASKKRENVSPHRKNYSQRDKREKKSGEQS